MQTYVSTTFHNRQRGLSLIEILVGLFIGLIGMLAMFTVFALAEENRRSSTSGSDAQVAAAIALFKLEREIAQAGHGFGKASDHFNCNVNMYRAGRTPAAFTMQLAPVLITDGGAGPDTIRVMYGNSNRSGSRQSYLISTPTAKQPEDGATAFEPLDMVLATETAGCGGAAAPSAWTIGVSTKVGGVFDHVGGPFNNPALPALPASGYLYNLGPAPVISEWAVGAVGTTQGLTVTDFMNVGPGGAVIAAENVIDLQAQYIIDRNLGIDSPDPEEIYFGTDPDALGAAHAIAEPWSKIVAIRVAILVRGEKWEKDQVTTVANSPTWRGGAFVLPAVLPDGTDPMNYRYKVYETTLPLRNLVWGLVNG